MNSDLTSHQQRGHSKTEPRFKVSSEILEKLGIDLAIPGLVVQCVNHPFKGLKLTNRCLPYIATRVYNTNVTNM